MAKVKEKAFDPTGPAVQLGSSTSLFPLHLAEVWRAKGLDVTIVARDANHDTTLASGIRILSVRQHCGHLFTKISKNQRFLHPLEDLISSLFKASYHRKTGQQHLLPRQADFIMNVIESVPTARIAQSVRPRFVFGHDAASYGLATALCKGVPKVLFPWGGEIFMGAEASPILFQLIRYSLKAADLIVPSSETAAAHITERFKIPAQKVQPVSWGVDQRLFLRAQGSQRDDICLKYGIDPKKKIISNPRRFRPTWGCFTALDAFARIATERDDVHFIMLGGLGTEQFVREGRKIIQQQGLSGRFTLIEGDIPLNDFAEIMSVSEIFVSLLGLGDMRSASVLQGIAAGAIPVISDNPEYRQMERSGFGAYFVRPDSTEDVYSAVNRLLKDPEQADIFRRKNLEYVSMYENADKQMDHLLSLIDDVCSSYC